MNTEERNRYWGMYTESDAVVHNGRYAHVVAVPRSVVPAGQVPVMYDDEGGCFITVPADDLSHRL